MNINTRNRHIRNVLFIEEDYPFDKLYDLIMNCNGLWGGRYTPIIPIVGGQIESKYLDIVQYYDPDYVYHTEKVSIDYIKELDMFSPIDYFNIDLAINRFEGLGSFFLISKIPKEHSIIDLVLSNGFRTSLKNFLELNLGITRMHMTESKLAQDYEIIKVDDSNFNDIPKLIHTKKVFNKSLLSTLNINTQVLRNKGRSPFEHFQLVISEDKGKNEDLLYYWNRQLFIFNHWVRPSQFFITETEFQELINLPVIDGLLYSISRDNEIEVISKSIEDKKLEELRKQLQSKTLSHRISISKNDFPFDIMDNNGIGPYQIGEPLVQQHFTSIKDDVFLNIPDVSFNQKKHPPSNTWFLDIDVYNSDSTSSNMRFCKTEDPQFFLRTKSRINKRNSISMEVNFATTTNNFVSFKIPDFFSRVKMMVQNPIIQTQRVTTKYQKIKLNDESYRLKSLIKLFGNNFHEISDFIEDKFWFEIIKELSINNRVEGDSITYLEVLERCKRLLPSLGIKLDPDKIKYYSEEDLKKGLRNTLFEYCERKIFFKGFTAKCPNCSSKYWFSLSEITDTIKCKGCEEKYSFPIEHPYSYKLNSLIQNNFFLNNGTKKESFAGNYTVLKTLNYLKNISRVSFQYNPQIDIYDSYLASKPITDIDIICESDGHLIIGEAKHDSKQLLEEKDKKSLNNLVKIAQEIKPSKLMLACTIDSHSKLDKSKKYLEHHIKKWDFEVEVLTYISSEPDYFSLSGNAIKYFGYN
ncbi:hypothetical protein [Psychroflexus sediminis]|uniref:Uncharacterized protein n=1 Tax=Psychroflexus sediminis TaxID=470826 RepID=A0A1G7XNA5_9FLAO|nr:hypothetical protein [Psychroflexus sediminis]SDG85581.1 hypothetical protein SAMN04488027_10921 [Psychroflexus sediminis]